MATITVEVRGIEALRGRLDVDGLGILQPVMSRAVIRVERAMKKYPTPPSDSSYVRTGTLGRRWTHEVQRGASEIRGVVGNNTQYGPWVQNEQFQARVHRGRWLTDEAALRAEAPRAVAEMEAAVQAIVS